MSSKAQELKAGFPIYPSIKRRVTPRGIVVFSTLIRKRYNKEYYLIPHVTEGPLEQEAHTIHVLNVEVYRYLMNGKQEPWNVKDDDQTLENTRIERTLVI